MNKTYMIERKDDSVWVKLRCEIWAKIEWAEESMAAALAFYPAEYRIVEV